MVNFYLCKGGGDVNINFFLIFSSSKLICFAVKIVAVTLSASVLGPIVIGIIIGLLGFGCGGVRKNSMASECHSLIGNVEEGSFFSCKF